MNQIERYFKKRQDLIQQYAKGDMTKSEYLSQNFDAVVFSGIEPFKNIDRVEKALFNYQYYNALAKYMKMKSSQKNVNTETKREYMDKANYYYTKKDKATFHVLRLLDYRDLYAYYIQVSSKYLKGKLIEIVLNDHESILHTTNTAIIQTLREENAFIEETRKSLIDGYINQKY